MRAMICCNQSSIQMRFDMASQNMRHVDEDDEHSFKNSAELTTMPSGPFDCHQMESVQKSALIVTVQNLAEFIRSFHLSERVGISQLLSLDSNLSNAGIFSLNRSR